MWMTYRRVLTSGAKSFARSGSVSFATVLIMTVTLAIIGLLIFLSAILTHTLTAIQDKVDVNAYFTTNAAESDILAIKGKLEGLPTVASVTYTSRDQALEQFKERHANDQLTLEALDQLGDNPLGATLAIKAKNPSQYQSIVDFLATIPSIGPDGNSIIDHVNYQQNKVVIDRLTGAIHALQQAGSIVVLIFSIASLLITLATIRLAIHTSRDEIAVMRLVGASNWYIRGPFIVAGVIAGVLAALIALALFYPVAWYTGNALSNWFGDFNLFVYYTSNFGLFFFVLVGSGLLLGALASYLAVRRYLRV